MTNLQSEAADLRKIFEKSIAVRDISSKFKYHSGENLTERVNKEMKKNSFDVVGVEKDGIKGYAVKT